MDRAFREDLEHGHKEFILQYKGNNRKDRGIGSIIWINYILNLKNKWRNCGDIRQKFLGIRVPKIASRPSLPVS